LLDKNTGQLAALSREYDLPEIKFNEDCIHLIPSPNSAGETLDDIRTPQEYMRAADFISSLVRNFCEDENAALHVSIAGGRKSMGFYMGYTLSLFARRQDRLSHVLVSRAFEDSGLYFPPNQSEYITAQGQSSQEEDEISLGEIPFVYLRGGIPDSLMSGGRTFAETVSGVQSGLNVVSLEFDVKRLEIICGGSPVKLEPADFAFYLWLAKRRVEDKVANGKVEQSENLLKEYIPIRRWVYVIANCSKHGDEWENGLLKLKKVGEDKTFFQRRITAIKGELERVLPLNKREYLIDRDGKRGGLSNYLRLPTDVIKLPKISIN
jgi:CRISPR-associated protein (TIGR02584 family)